MHRRTVRAVRAADASAPCVSSSPRSAARPISAGAATPAACPAAPGHVAASTAHVQVSARARSPGCRQKSHTAPTPIAKRTSSAVRRDAARSSRTCSGVRTVCARCRAAIVRCSAVASPIAVGVMNALPARLSVPARTASPTAFSAGRAAPVRADASTVQVPEHTTPSTGTRSPGRTRTTLRGVSASASTCVPTPSRTTVAVRGRRCRSRRTGT